MHLCFLHSETKHRDQKSGSEFITKPLGAVSLFWGSNTHFSCARSGKCGTIQYVSQSHHSANHPSQLLWRRFPQIERWQLRWEATFTACQKLSVIIGTFVPPFFFYWWQSQSIHSLEVSEQSSRDGDGRGGFL